jgi:hypothetical protein
VPKDLAIILHDGSIESAVTTSLAAQRHRIAMIYVSDDSPGAPRRRGAFDAQAAHFAAQKTWITPPINLDPPKKEPSTTPLQQKMLATIAPIGLAAQAADRWAATTLYLPLRTGPAEDDLARATEYLQIAAELLQLPCNRPDLDITAPILELDLWQVVDLASQLDTPLELTWSCQTSTTPLPCGLCPPCKSRQAAFARAAKPDPLLLIKDRS